MKKKIISISFISVLLLSLPALPVFSATSKKTSDKIFSGRVIYIADNYIELKKGKTEAVVYISENSKYFSKDGKEGGKDIIGICQYVEAHYSESGAKKILNKIVVIKESDCVK